MMKFIFCFLVVVSTVIVGGTPGTIIYLCRYGVRVLMKFRLVD